MLACLASFVLIVTSRLLADDLLRVVVLTSNFCSSSFALLLYLWNRLVDIVALFDLYP